MKNLLEVKNLRTCFYTEDGALHAVDGVDIALEPGRTLGIVGESGCGKSVTAFSILRLLPDPPGRIIGGEVLFEGKDLLRMSESDMRRIRGNDIAMIFQEPMTSLNPVFTIGRQIGEAIMLHQGMDRKRARERTLEMLRLVGIPGAGQVADDYPHELSGGMRQRAAIAMALSCSPRLLIADEPTTALDVTIQAQILALMKDIREKLRMSIMLITHDLGVIAEMADQVIVMYAGKVMEEAEVMDLFREPLHPYTIGLMKSKPGLGREGGRLEVIEGAVPDPFSLPEGCPFHPRCKEVMAVCRTEMPGLSSCGDGRRVRCWLYDAKGGRT